MCKDHKTIFCGIRKYSNISDNHTHCQCELTTQVGMKMYSGMVESFLSGNVYNGV